MYNLETEMATPEVETQTEIASLLFGVTMQVYDVVDFYPRGALRDEMPIGSIPLSDVPDYLNTPEAVLAQLDKKARDRYLRDVRGAIKSKPSVTDNPPWDLSKRLAPEKIVPGLTYDQLSRFFFGHEFRAGQKIVFLSHPAEKHSIHIICVDESFDRELYSTADFLQESPTKRYRPPKVSRESWRMDLTSWGEDDFQKPNEAKDKGQKKRPEITDKFWGAMMGADKNTFLLLLDHSKELNVATESLRRMAKKKGTRICKEILGRIKGGKMGRERGGG
ncbi:MAG: hypothetical protein UX80_C0006G0034 [Candidatus Amesbacteria bacterium GW2011_GWA2_47_11b]|uniref:Uncharacterized protein n=3 Tax=Candidatus Amesiibacteriota TaxID=1752730 RepID=A0A0G1SI80_9BACT|nr:MAG: hypothetical protein UX42_C0003G0030 [Microgenomates group bacterium GW2011_GWC1_46_20]KKU58064.1 MAG: hypothetical protein UX80_C0006G0034 [Candidatus Amesbacteria bacterium GW2011_GWA2_47_11b]KKU69116.1 MAG: hypothetical protein UX92_C0014G0007 [Candidatus Amesbacteria bacterium GW2011_GWA1_47_20]KKU84034.1 MAG: hypothetical protein UY11_C0007G0013 [Candidatus Amesbacteria bacterium GW2011_GWC2_47_8]